MELALITERDYQPSLFWARASAWYEQQPLDAPYQPRPLGPHDLTIYIYRSDAPGAWMMTGPKLYWADEPMHGQYFRSTDQGDLAENAGVLGEVVLWDRRIRRTILLGKTFAEALDRLT